jgi:hypothetical protein
MKELTNNIHLIGRPQTSANQTNSSRGGHSPAVATALCRRVCGAKAPKFILNILALISFGLLPAAYARTDLFQPFAGEDLGHGNSAAENVEALVSLTSGVNNTSTGVQSLLYTTTGIANTATGFQSLLNNTSGSWNLANGDSALRNNTTGDYNTAVGSQALLYNTTGSQNTAEGFRALYNNATGYFNAAVGVAALYGNATGSYNTAAGYPALSSNTGGWYNTAIGDQALGTNSTGSYNIAIGDFAGYYQSTGSGNIYIGSGVRGVAGENSSCYIGSIWGQTSSGGTAVFINGDGKLGTTTSSRRFKQDIKPMNRASESLFALKPVTFRYKKELDPKGIPQFGLIAEEVEKVNPDLVVRDKQGKVNTVRYEQINAMLLNEFLKEHKTVEKQQATIGQLKSDAAKQEQTISALKKGMGLLTAQVKEQAAQIQKVSAQLATTRPAPRVATNR